MNLLLEKCSRSVPAQTLRKALPEAVHGAIIDDFVPAAEPLFSGIGEDSMSRVARAVFQRIEQREDADELQEWLEDEHEGLDDSLQVDIPTQVDHGFLSFNLSCSGRALESGVTDESHFSLRWTKNSFAINQPL